MFFFMFFQNTPYIAIIGDIKKSKKLLERKLVQDRLKEILKRINEKYSDDISSKFIITLGDEFQGLLHNGKNILNIIETIEREMYPIKIRFGIGIGEITTDIDFEMALGADGPGYYSARKAINYLKQNEGRNKTQVADIRIEIEDDKYSVGEMLNTILSLMAVLKGEWTDRQREIIWDYDYYQDSQKNCAKRLGISQSSVQRSLNNGNYYAYREAKDKINEIMSQIGREYE